jgi:reactive chlorine resistance protein C
MSTTALHQAGDNLGLIGRARPLHLFGAQTMEAWGRNTARYGLVLVLVWIGGMKFTAYEAEGISGFVSNSPLMSWAYSVFSKGQFSAILGVTELLTAALIAARPFSARLSAAGSALAVGMFLTTLTFLFSTPGVIELSLGFPALSAVPGQFLIKDVVLLGVALWTLGEALGAVRQKGT